MNQAPIQRVTRLAPSPTGALHLGNARTFLVNWALARQSGWSIVFRVEDLDGPRVKSGADEQAVRDLRWLGIDWDLDAGRQRADLSPYERALDSLRQRGLVYPCRCTRKEIEQAQSAPHAGEHELRYPGTCRGAAASSAGADAAWRLIVPDEPVEFIDEVAGPQRFNVQQQVGDFVVATKMGLPAYQLAVVVDDARQGVSDVVRGDDLLPSTARQIWLWRMLSPRAAPGSPAPGTVAFGNAAPLPRWWHLPLVYGPDGHRLAKRHGDTRLAWYRDQGVTPQRVIGLLAYWCGLSSARQAMTAAEFRDGFSLERLPRQAVTFTAEDHAWLLA